MIFYSICFEVLRGPVILVLTAAFKLKMDRSQPSERVTGSHDAWKSPQAYLRAARTIAGVSRLTYLLASKKYFFDQSNKIRNQVQISSEPLTRRYLLSSEVDTASPDPLKEVVELVTHRSRGVPPWIVRVVLEIRPLDHEFRCSECRNR